MRGVMPYGFCDVLCRPCVFVCVFGFLLACLISLPRKYDLLFMKILASEVQRNSNLNFGDIEICCESGGVNAKKTGHKAKGKK